MSKHLVVTGAGSVTAQGNDHATVFRQLYSGTSALAPLRVFDREHYRSQYAYEIDDRKGADEPLRSYAGCAALREALAEHGPLDAARVVAIVGTGLCELRSLELMSLGQAEFQPHQLHYADAVQGVVGRDVPVFTLVNACAAGLFGLGLAADMLELDEADVVIVAGTDSITESMYGLLDRSSSVRTQAVQPFERERCGVLMGEGAAAVILTRAELAQRRKIIGRLRGVGMSCDASHETAPDADGLLRAMQDAHARAGSVPGQVDLVYAHGTGTPLNDLAEALAMRSLFISEHKPHVTAIKSMTGHTAGSSGLVSLVAALDGLREQSVPPTLGVSDPIDELAGFTLVRDRGRPLEHRFVQIDAFGFGGVNAVALVEAADA